MRILVVEDSPKMASLLKALIEMSKTETENVPHGSAALGQEAVAILRYIDQDSPQ